MVRSSGRDKLRRGRQKAAGDENEQINKEEVKGILQLRIQEKQDAAVELWDHFMEDYQKEKGFTPTLADFELPKAYVDEIAGGTKGSLGIKKPSVSTVLKE